MGRQIQVTFDAHDPAALSLFWRDALGYVHPGSPGVAMVSEDKTAKDRVRRFEPEPPLSLGFIVMTHPEGIEFCLD